MIRKLVDKLLTSPRAPELLASTVAINVLALGSSFYSIHLLNRYVPIGLTPTLVTLTVGVLLAIVLEVMLRKVRQRVLTSLADEADAVASERVLKAFSKTRYEPLNLIPMPGRREALGAPATIQQLTSTTNLASILDLPFAMIFVIGALLLYWPLGIFAILACGLALLLGVIGERGQRAAAEEHSKSSSRAQQLGQFLLTAGEAVRCLPMGGHLSRRWSEVQGASLTSRRDGMILQANLQQAIQNIGQFLTVLVYCVGAMAVVLGDLTTGALIGANILASRAFAVCSRAAYLADPLLRADRADAALRKVEETESEPMGGVIPARLEGHLSVSDVAFAYPQQPVPLFESLNIDLPPKQVLVLTGPNGSGKSTMIKLLLGLLAPVRGLMRIDGIELRQLSQEWWRGQIGYAPQDAVFFDGTLRENLLLDREIDDATVLELVREMGLENFLASDPAGLDRQISSHDTGMATGLRRRFVLVRAVLGNPRVIFLDDPTEGLDQAGQAAVAKLLNRLLTDGRTLVVASNEAFILRAADVVVDMSKQPTPTVARATRPAPEAGEAP